MTHTKKVHSIAQSAPLDVQVPGNVEMPKKLKALWQPKFLQWCHFGDACKHLAKRGLQTSSPITMQKPTSKLTTLSTPSYTLTNHSPEPPSSLFASSQREGRARQVFTLHPTIIFHITCMET